MKKVFIIGTGRNGSKLLAAMLETGSNAVLYGENHDGPEPRWFKEIYEGKGDLKGRMVRFKDIRGLRFKDDQGVYVEKNHLLAPILKQLPKLWPEAKFLYLKRNSRSVIRSFVERNWYSEEDLAGEYGKGRLVPKKGPKKWAKKSTFEKCCWLYFEYSRMLEEFFKQIDDDHIRIVKYKQLSNDAYMKAIFNWCEIADFNEFKLIDIRKQQFGTKTENTPKYKDWSDEWKTIYEAYKTSFQEIISGSD